MTKPNPLEADEEITPAFIIFGMLDEALRRTTPAGGREFGEYNGILFHYVALDKRIDAYIDRLLSKSRSDLLREVISELLDENTDCAEFYVGNDEGCDPEEHRRRNARFFMRMEIRDYLNTKLKGME